MAKTLPLKELKFEQAGTEGRLTETKVLVTPTSGDRLPLLFTRERKERPPLLEAATALINAAFDQRKQRLENTPSINAGEVDLVGRKIDESRKNSLRWIGSQSNATLRVLTGNFNESSESLERLDKMLKDMGISRSGSEVREALVFNEELTGEYLSLVKPQIDNLRTCHPSLAREDLSELDGSLLESARLLLRMSIGYESRAQQKHWNAPAKGEFAKDINSARSTIIRHDRHMTPALAGVVIDHPEKLDLVLEALKERGIPLAQADSLIQEIVNASSPLSSGAL